MPSIQVSTSTQDEYLALIANRLDMGNALPRPELRIYSTGGPEHGTLIAVLQMYLPSFTPPSHGRMSANPITPCTNAIASGVAETFRLVSMANIPICGGSIGPAPEPDPRTGERPPSPYAITLEGGNDIRAGSVVRIDGLTITYHNLFGG